MSVTGARGASGRPPVSGRPCVGILLCPCPPDDVAPMMMHTHTGASLSVIACVCYSCRPCRYSPVSVIACVCYSCRPCRLYSFGVGKLLPERD